MITAAVVIFALFVYRALWKKSPMFALIALIACVILMFVVFGNWNGWREYMFITPSGRLGDIR